MKWVCQYVKTFLHTLLQFEKKKKVEMSCKTNPFSSWFSGHIAKNGKILNKVITAISVEMTVKSSFFRNKKTACSVKWIMPVLTDSR